MNPLTPWALAKYAEPICTGPLSEPVLVSTTRPCAGTVPLHVDDMVEPAAEVSGRTCAEPSLLLNLNEACDGVAFVLTISNTVFHPPPTASCEIIPLPGSVVAATGMLVKCSVAGALLRIPASCRFAGESTPPVPAAWSAAGTALVS